MVVVVPGVGSIGIVNVADMNGVVGIMKSAAKSMVDDMNNSLDYTANGSPDHLLALLRMGSVGLSLNKNNKGKWPVITNFGIGKHGLGRVTLIIGRVTFNRNRLSPVRNLIQGDVYHFGTSREVGNAESNHDLAYYNQPVESIVDQQGIVTHQDAKAMLGITTIRSSKYLSVISVHADKTQATTGELHKEIVQEVICTVLENGNKAGEKTIITLILIMLDCVDNKKRDMHLGMHSAFDGAIIACPIPKLAVLVERHLGNDSDDTEPLCLHKPIHDKNLIVVVGEALLNQCGKENIAQFVKLKMIGMAKIAVDILDGPLIESANGDPEHLGVDAPSQNSCDKKRNRRGASCKDKTAHELDNFIKRALSLLIPDLDRPVRDLSEVGKMLGAQEGLL